MIVVYLYKYIQINNLRVLVSVVLPFFWSKCIIMSNSVLNLYWIFCVIGEISAAFPFR